MLFAQIEKHFFLNEYMILYVESSVITGNHAFSAERFYFKKQSASH